MISLQHSFVWTAVTTGVFDTVTDIDSLIKNIHKTAHQLYASNEKERNSFCGNAFETFGEFFFQATAYDNRVGVSNYTPNFEKDLGVDGKGTGFDGNSAVIQYKFRANKAERLKFEELGTFGNFAAMKSGILAPIHINEIVQQLIDSNQFSKEVIESIKKTTKSTMPNMFLVTTAFDVSHHWKNVNHHATFIGYNELKSLTQGMKNFWNDFRLSLIHSVPKKKIRVELDRYLHQQQINKKTEQFLLNSEVARGQIICATGGGKTLCQIDAMDFAIQHNNAKIIVFLSPRIQLSRQHIYEINEKQNGKSNINLQLICSGDDVLCSGYIDNSAPITLIESTCEISQIQNWFKQASNTQPLVICCTYHSAPKLKTICDTIFQKIDVLICDEAHNLTNEQFNRLVNPTTDFCIPALNYLFYTATRKVDYSGRGRGMNNIKTFGEILIQVLPKKLIDAGIILPPKIRVCRYEPINFFDDESDEALRVNIAMIISGIKSHEQAFTNECRVIIDCGNAATEPRDYMKNKVIQKYLSNYYMIAITAKESLEKRLEETDVHSVNRDEALKQFINHKKAILFHYDVVNEGIDFPGVTGKLPLRNLNNIKTIQGIGRTLRLHIEDRARFKKGEIFLSDKSTWIKTHGEFIVPLIDGHNEDDMKRMFDVVKSMSEDGFNIDLELFDNVPITAKGSNFPDGNLSSLNTQQRMIPNFGITEIETILEKIEKEEAPFSEDSINKRFFSNQIKERYL